jgi:hypothetical protein
VFAELAALAIDRPASKQRNEKYEPVSPIQFAGCEVVHSDLFFAVFGIDQRVCFWNGRLLIVLSHVFAIACSIHAN